MLNFILIASSLLSPGPKWPGWVLHQNRTIYEVNVSQASDQKSTLEGLKELDLQLPYIESLGVGAVVLDGIKFDQPLSSDVQGQLTRLKNDLQDQSIEVLLGVGPERQYEPQLSSLEVSSGAKGSFLNAAAWVNHPSPEPAWPIRSIADSDWKSFLLPGPDQAAILPSQLQEKSGWLRTSPESGTRLFSLFKGNLNLLKQALVAEFTGTCSPDLVFGDEIGLADPAGTMIWASSRQNLALLNFVQSLVQLRQKRSSLAQGDFQLIKQEGSDNGVIAYSRTYRFETTVVVFNCRDQSQNAFIPGSLFGGQDVSSILDSTDEGSSQLNIQVSIPAHGVKILVATTSISS